MKLILKIAALKLADEKAKEAK